MKVSFNSDHIVVNDLFARDIYYTIPHYQRPYSWESVGKSERNNQVNVMWEDLLAFFKEGSEGEYFFGSMVMIDKGNRSYEVIDGQQRLTTLVILFVAIKCFLKKIQEAGNEKEASLKDYLTGAIEAIDDILFNKARIGLRLEKKLRIEKSADFNYDTILSEIMECKKSSSFQKNELNSEQKLIIDRYFKNRNFFEEKIKEEFITVDYFSEKDFTKLTDFVKFLENSVSLIRIGAPDLNIAYRIFEVLNNRGLQLSDKDLFRNFIISEFAYLRDKNPEKFADIDPNKKWTDLEQEYIITTDFIRRWVESMNAVQSTTTPYNELYSIFQKFENKPNAYKIELFYEKIKQDLKLYSFIIADKISNTELKNRILFLLKCGNASYTINLLLALFRHLKYEGTENEKLRRFLITYEVFMMYLILSPGRRFSKTPVNEAVTFLNEGNYEAAVNCFTLGKHEKDEIAGHLNDGIQDNNIAKLFIAKYVWILEAESKDVVSQQLNFEKASLEHIAPQNPGKKSNWGKVFSKADIYRLGNMTLLTQSMNSSAKNFDFSAKKKIYAKTLLPITNELAQKDSFTTDDFERRQSQMVSKILTDAEIEFDDSHDFFKTQF